MEKKRTAFCEYCEKEETYSCTKAEEESTVRGVKVISPTTHCFCDACHHEIFVNEVVDEDLKQAYEAYKEKMGMVTGQQILELRKERHLSAVELSRLIGAGDKTITRYENGSIQDPIFDRILHLLLKPEGYTLWVKENPNVLPEETEKIREEEKKDFLYKNVFILTREIDRIYERYLKKSAKTIDLTWEAAARFEIDPLPSSTNVAKPAKPAEA